MEQSSHPFLGVLPEDVKITAKYLDPADPSQLIIEYFYQGSYTKVTPKRLVLEDYVTSNNNIIYLFDGMTNNDVYEIYSKRFNLGLIKGDDYLDDPTPITKPGRCYLPINPLSNRYQNTTLIINIVNKSALFIGDEISRNLTLYDFNPFKGDLTERLHPLSYLFIDGRGSICFEENIPTMIFRNLIVNEADQTDSELINEIKSSYALWAFNDGLSDIVVLVGPSQLPYSVRFITDQGDVPVFN